MLANRIILAAGGRKLDQYTKSLLHFNGANGSTNFKDETGKVWTRNSGAINTIIDTGKYKFGGASINFWSGDADHIITPSHNDFNLDSENFTIEFFINIPNISSQGTILHCGKYTQDYRYTSYAIIYVYDDDGYNRIIARFHSAKSSFIELRINANFTSDDLNKWHHAAIVRNGNSFKSYWNGVNTATQTFSNALYASPAFDLYLGGFPDYNGMRFYMDEFRLSKGIARWTANFTPPTKEY